MSALAENPVSLGGLKDTHVTATAVSEQSDLRKYSFEHLVPYVHPPETKEDLPWSELVTLDLSEFSQPGGKQRLAAQLSHAVHQVGFFYVKNFGLTQERIDRQFTLAKNFFNLPLEEKQEYSVDYARADYNGYRARGPRYNGSTVGDNIEMYNIPKFIPEIEGKYKHPPLIQAHLDEIQVFSKHLHQHIIIPLMVLFGIILELPDENLIAREHSYDIPSEDHFRYMKYSKRTAEEHEASDYFQSRGHTDLGSVTLLFRQPVAGLQILNDETKTWTYVQAQPGTITVNLADTLSLLTGGFLKSSVHRVVAPPRDQWAYDRTGLLYFARPHNDTVLRSLVEVSPVLQRNKDTLRETLTQPITMLDFVRAKQRMQLNPQLYEGKRDEQGGLELIAGFKDQKYN